MESIHIPDDQSRAGRSSRGISLLRAPIRHDITTNLSGQTVYSEQGNVLTSETGNQQGQYQRENVVTSEIENQQGILELENVVTNGTVNQHGLRELENVLESGARFKDIKLERGQTGTKDQHNHGDTLTSGALNHTYFLNRDTVFNRALSQPSERSYDLKGERQHLERTIMFNRSFSQPRSKDYFDINKAIHEELVNNPWGTYRRVPRKCDRYAIYVPDPGNCDSEFSNCGREEYMEHGLNVNTEANNWDKYEHQGNAYATFRRAPRAYPRLDVDNDEYRDVGNGQPQATRDTRRDGVIFSNFSKIPNDENRIANNSVMIKNNLHEKLEQQSSVQHLFSVKLNDVRQSNATDTDISRNYLDRSGKLNKIENIMSEKKSEKGFFKNNRRKSQTSIESNESQNATQKKPFFYCRWVAEYPKTLFLLTLGGHILIALITMVLLLSGYDLFPTEFEFLPMYDLKVPWLKRDFAWRFRNEYKTRYVRKWYIQGLNKWYRSMAFDRANVIIYYDTGGGNIFTKENLKHMEIVERDISNIHNYSNYCVSTILLKCQKLTSVLRYFDGTYVNVDPVFNDPEYNNIAKVLYAARTNNETKSDFAYFLSKDHHVTRNYAYAQKTRTLVPIGFPIKLNQKREKMEDDMELFLVTNVKPVIERLIESTPGLKIIYWSFLLFKHDIVIQIFYDLMFAFGSLLFIFGFIVYHTKSLWISTFAVSSILTSFLCTNIIYRVILDFRYFGFFHVITLFIILGIGADDLFVFLDVWKNTGFETFPSLAHRLSSAYKKSMKSMFFTSLTTTAAFFISSFSPLLATKSFGVFAALLVVVNYISVVVYFPTVVVLHHLYIKTWTWPCFSYVSEKINRIKEATFKRKDNRSNVIKDKPSNVQCIFDDNSVIGSAGNRYNVVGKVNPSFRVGKVNPSFRVGEVNPSFGVGEVNPSFRTDIDDEYGFIKFKNDATGTTAAVNGSIIQERISTDTDEKSKANWNSSEGKRKKKLLVRFFRDYYFKFVTHWLIKWIIVIILISLVIFFMYCISTIETENEPAQFYRNSHNYGKALDLDFHGFIANKNDMNVVVYIVWGVKERDMTGCHFSKARCIGVENYDQTFNPNSEEAQLALKKFCNKLLSFSDLDVENFKIRRDFSTGKPEIKCFANDLDRSLREESFRTGTNLSLPWDYRKTISFMQSKSLIYNTMKFNSSFPNVFEIPISYWLNDGYRFQNKEQFEKYHYLIGEGTNYYSTPMKSDFSVFYGNRIIYLGVEVNLTLGRFSSGYPEGKPVMDRWEAFVQDQVRRMPPGMQNGFQLTKDYWHNLSVQKTIEDSAIIGVVVGILLAFPILTLATKNILIGFFATLSICCSSICVVGMVPLAGYKLGLLESLNMCMVVGLTVDYVVHLAEGYHLSKRLDRKSRVQDMLEVMGISVFSGACTTLGASVFMFFAQIQFIIRFGMFMFSTIAFSLLYSLGFFTTVMGILGPSGDSCDITNIAALRIACTDLFHQNILKGQSSRQLSSSIKLHCAAMANRKFPLDFKSTNTVCKTTITSGHSCTSFARNMSPEIQVKPNGHLLIDDRLEIKIDNLAQNQKVTIYAYLNEEGKKFESCGCFKTDDNGAVDLSRQSSLSGTYTGISPMGLFWSMVPCPGQMEGIRLLKKNMDTSFKTTVHVYDGHFSLDELREKTPPELCTSVIERWYKSQDVTSYEVKDGNVRGKLYLPPGDGPFPGVIDLFGTVGGLTEYRSALLASRGLASLALPYFLYQDLPDNLFDLNLDYFLEAIDWMLSHKKIISSGVGVIGVSKGGDIAFLMGANSPKVRAIVNINGCTFNASVPMKYSGGDIPEVPLLWDRMENIDGIYATRKALEYLPSDITPVWKNSAKILNILSEDDMCSPKECIRMLKDIYPIEKTDNCVVVSYRDAGHLVEPPYTPLCRMSYHKSFEMRFWWGGHPEPHAFAQEDSWRRILKFFHEELPVATAKL